MTPNLPTLGEFIVQHRTKLGMSQSALASEVGVPRSTMLRLETGAIERPDPEKLQRLARALDIDAEDLFELAGYTPDGALPSFGPYLRRKFDLPIEARDRMEKYLTRIRKEYGEDSDAKPDR